MFLRSWSSSILTAAAASVAAAAPGHARPAVGRPRQRRPGRPERRRVRRARRRREQQVSHRATSRPSIFTDAPIPAAETSEGPGGTRPGRPPQRPTSFYGSLADIGGASPLRLSFSTPDGDRELNSDEVARIYFASWQGMPGVDRSGQTDGRPRPGRRRADHPGRTPCWTNTGRSVRQRPARDVQRPGRDPVERGRERHRRRGGIAHRPDVAERADSWRAGGRPHRPRRQQPAVRDRRSEDRAGMPAAGQLWPGHQRRPLRRQPRPVQGADQPPAGRPPRPSARDRRGKARRGARRRAAPGLSRFRARIRGSPWPTGKTRSTCRRPASR
ncbi:MAG: hypothetical protein M0C28_13415 [Candidatus Moduliflexus flocculans]|nr:hypothetical protein [Candidatus Moduliflexus flocculans]